MVMKIQPKSTHHKVTAKAAFPKSCKPIVSACVCVCVCVCVCMCVYVCVFLDRLGEWDGIYKIFFANDKNKKFDKKLSER